MECIPRLIGAVFGGYTPLASLGRYDSSIGGRRSLRRWQTTDSGGGKRPLYGERRATGTVLGLINEGVV